jgi:hypothetical protein
LSSPISSSKVTAAATATAAPPVPVVVVVPAAMEAGLQARVSLHGVALQFLEADGVKNRPKATAKATPKDEKDPDRPVPSDHVHGFQEVMMAVSVQVVPEMVHKQRRGARRQP